MIISIMSAMGSKNSALWMIKKIGTNSKYYPKGFVEPAKWMKSRYHISDGMIPIFTYYSLILSAFFLLLGPINIVCFLLFRAVPNIVGILIMVHISLSVVEACVSSIGYLLYKA